MRHTEGKLVAVEDWIESENNKHVVVAVARGPSETKKANARRLVACWNACKGIPTDALEAGSMESLFNSLSQNVDDARKERDEYADMYRWLRENIHRLQGMRPGHAPKPEELDAAINREREELK